MLEGTRRLSLVLGLLGVATGLLVSWGPWSDLREADRQWRLAEERAAVWQERHPPALEGDRPRSEFKVGDFIDPSEIVAIDAPSVSKPSYADYLLVLVIPLACFLLPWGTIRVGSWVVEGFFKDWGSRRAPR